MALVVSERFVAVGRWMFLGGNDAHRQIRRALSASMHISSLIRGNPRRARRRSLIGLIFFVSCTTPRRAKISGAQCVDFFEAFAVNPCLSLRYFPICPRGRM